MITRIINNSDVLDHITNIAPKQHIKAIKKLCGEPKTMNSMGGDISHEQKYDKQAETFINIALINGDCQSIVGFQSDHQEDLQFQKAIEESKRMDDARKSKIEKCLVCKQMIIAHQLPTHVNACLDDMESSNDLNDDNIEKDTKYDVDYRLVKQSLE